jgi:hypothetical protein
MNHLESLVKQFYEWQRYTVRNNVRVGLLPHGGYESELDIVAYNPEHPHLVHLETSVDADSWETRESRFRKKFDAGRKYIRTEVFPWLQDTSVSIEQVAIVISGGRRELAGGRVESIDEFVKRVKEEVAKEGSAYRNAISEEFALLRTIQFVVCGYYKAR